MVGGQWVDAANLQAGYKLLDVNNQWHDIVSVIVKSESLKAYNLTVDQTHTYFIKGVEANDGVWDHNVCNNIIGNMKAWFSSNPFAQAVGSASKKAISFI